jgi:uncharacterized protein
MPVLRVVLDTNVLVSGLAYPNGPPARILRAWLDGGVHIVLSQYIRDEVVRVLPRVSRDRIGAAAAQLLADSFLFMADVVEPSETLEGRLRDAADAPILGTLLASRADYLITGDKDLLVLADRYPIVTPAEFWRRHGS